MTKLEDTARELGFKIRRGPTRYAGYNLIDKREAEEEYPLGDDFSASLADVENFLEALADDIAAGRVKATTDDDDAEPEVETSANVHKVKPPSPQKLAASLRGHEHAAEIKALAKSAKVADPTGPTLHDLKFEVRALQSRLEHKPNWNNVGGLHDFNEHDEEDDSYLRQFLEDEKRKRESFEKYLAPDKATPGYDTPKAATAFVTTSINRRVKKADVTPKARTLLTIETAIRAAQLKGDKAGIGKLLLEAKARTLDHGEFMTWAERATGLTSRSCRNYMAMADQTENKY